MTQQPVTKPGGQMVAPAQQATIILEALQSPKTQAAIARALPAIMSPQRFLGLVLNTLRHNPTLRRCTEDSIVGAVVECAAYGLEIDVGGQAYLVPFRNKGVLEATLIIGYKGLCTMAYRHPAVQTIQGGIVRQGDEFRVMYGSAPQIVHEPALDPTKPLTHAYTVITVRGGENLFMPVMSKAEIDVVRARSKAGQSGPWVTDYEAMALKTVLRRVIKTAPTSTELQRAIAVEEMREMGLPVDYRDAIPTEVQVLGDDGADDGAGGLATETDEKTTETPQGAGAVAPPKLSQPQVNRLWAIARTAGATETSVHDMLRREYGVEHVADLTREQYEAVCAQLEGQKRK